MKALHIFLFLFVLDSSSSLADGSDGPWKTAHAGLYGGGNNGASGACGYNGNNHQPINGVNRTALSRALFNNGINCGACFLIKCSDQASHWCQPGSPSIVVTATGLCPPNFPSDFCLTMPIFLNIAQYRAGIVPVSYLRVPCNGEQRRPRGVGPGPLLPGHRQSPKFP